MVFVVKGGRLRISGLTLSVADEGPTGHATIEMGLDLWPSWFEIAVDHTEIAAGAAAKLKPQLSDDERGALLATECKSAMVAIAAAAFALDSLFGSVRVRRDTASLDAKWKRANTPRHRRITELLGATFRFSKTKQRELSTVTQQIFALRDRAVHPSANFEPPVRHDGLGLAVPWPYATFSAQNADRALRFVAGVMKHCCTNVRKGYPEVSKWSSAAQLELDSFLPRIQALQT